MYFWHHITLLQPLRRLARCLPRLLLQLLRVRVLHADASRACEWRRISDPVGGVIDVVLESSDLVGFEKAGPHQRVRVRGLVIGFSSSTLAGQLGTCRHLLEKTERTSIIKELSSSKHCKWRSMGR